MFQPVASLLLVTPYSLEEGDWVRRIVATWRQAAPELLPDFADYREPARQPFPAELSEADVTRLQRGWYARRVSPRMRFRCGYGVWHPSDLELEVRERSIGPLLPAVCSWSEALAQLLVADHALVHVLTHDELAAEPFRPDVWRPHFIDRREADRVRNQGPAWSIDLKPGDK